MGFDDMQEENIESKTSPDAPPDASPDVTMTGPNGESSSELHLKNHHCRIKLRNEDEYTCHPNTRCSALITKATVIGLFDQYFDVKDSHYWDRLYKEYHYFTLDTLMAISTTESLSNVHKKLLIKKNQ